MIQINQLQKRFGTKVAVDIEQLSMGEPGIIGIVGNNGAGKSTLFRLMLDLLQADRGEVRMDDQAVTASEEWKSYVGAFLEAGFLIDYLTPQEYFAFLGKIADVSDQTVQDFYKRYKHFLPEEDDFTGTYIRELSAGNQQKVGIVSTLLHQPRYVLLDEPFNFLDPSSQLVLKRILQQYATEQGACIIVSSHNLNHIGDFCQRVILMENGKLLQDLNSAETDIEATLTDYFTSQLDASV